MTAAKKPPSARLAALLALAEGDCNTFDPERLAAINAVEKALKATGHRLRDLALPAPPREHKAPLMGTWRGTCQQLVERKNDLRPWERGFVSDLPKFARITSKQRYTLNAIAERLGVRP